MKDEIKVYKYGEIPQKYLSENRKWQAIATVECTGKRIWAAWMAGGVTEPDPDNYIVVAVSDDGGKSFIDPFMVIDCESQSVRGRDPVLWKDGDSLWLYYGFEKTYGIRFDSPWFITDNPAMQDPVVVFEKGMILNKPIRLNNGDLICSFDEYEKARNYESNACFESEDGGESWKKRGEIVSDSEGKWFQEGAFLQKTDGKLVAFTRIELAKNGGIEKSYSLDCGRTWSKPVYNLGYPFYGPGSKFCLTRLKSGNLLFVNNNSEDKSRVNMSAYLSCDDGKTWSALLLDYRDMCAYPDFTQDNDGNIYVIFDCGRKTRNEIVLCKFTEDDVKKGCLKSGGYLNRPISKNAEYKDIKSVEFIDGTSVKAVTEDGKEYILKGETEERIINNEKYLYFNCKEEAERDKLTDRFALLLRKKRNVLPNNFCRQK